MIASPWIDQPPLAPFLQALTAAHKITFGDAIVERVLSRARQPDGRCFETFRRINLLARR